MAGAELRVVGLHEQPLLINGAARLLNEQWHRSLEARKHSIHENAPELPCSLLLITSEHHVCGHVRILRVKGQTDEALIESLVIAHRLRGHGLGRRLMTAAEDYIRRLGYKMVHLSTHDQHDFYKHIGYIEGPSVTGRRKCNVIAGSNNGCNETDNIIEASEDDYDSNDTQNIDFSLLKGISAIPLSISTTPSSPTPPPPPPPAPPPPGPPPPALGPLPLTKTTENTMLKWYMKSL